MVFRLADNVLEANILTKKKLEMFEVKTFLPMIDAILDNVSRRKWRLWNHVNPLTGACPRSLNHIFQTWILSVIEYGSPAWIFRLHDPDKFLYDTDYTRNYKSHFLPLERFYIGCGRTILGVPPDTSDKSVLIRLGWLPLEYYLAFRSCIWYLKIMRGEAGTALKIIHDEFYNDFSTYWNPKWYRTRFFMPARKLITRLNKILNDTDIFSLKIENAKIAIKKAMYLELTDLWNNNKCSAFTRRIHPEWKERPLARFMFSKEANVAYHRFAVNRGPTNDLKFKQNRCNSDRCRFGCHVCETVEHLFIDCKKLTNERENLKNEFKKRNIDFTLKNILTTSCVQYHVEKFISKFLD